MRRVAPAAFLAALALSPAAQAERYALQYRGAVFGILPLGEARLDIDADEQGYRVVARLESSGLLDLFERTDLVAESSGEIAADGVRWRNYDLDHHYSRKRRTVSMRNGPEGVAADIEPTYPVWGEPPANDEQKRAARDPLSSLVAMAADVGRTHACANDYLTFDGRFLYRLELRGGEMRRFANGGYDGWALRCRLRYVPVAGFEPRGGGGRRGRAPGRGGRGRDLVCAAGGRDHRAARARALAAGGGPRRDHADALAGAARRNRAGRSADVGAVSLLLITAACRARNRPSLRAARCARAP
jgi:hypothetical protein